MSLYANIGGERHRAIRDGPRSAECQDCGQPMIAKTGDVKIWHWAHRTENPNCEAASETEWHLAWKALGPPGSQERAVGNRRADVLAPGGFAVEFQKSAMTAAEVAAREADWGHQMVWVFDAAEAYEAGRLTTRPRPSQPDEAFRKLRWAHAPERVKAARCRALLDLGGGYLVTVGRWFKESSPINGYGWQVTRDWVVAYVLNGERIPPLPKYQQPVNTIQLDVRSAQRVAAYTAGLALRATRLTDLRSESEHRCKSADPADLQLALTVARHQPAIAEMRGRYPDAPWDPSRPTSRQALMREWAAKGQQYLIDGLRQQGHGS